MGNDSIDYFTKSEADTRALQAILKGLRRKIAEYTKKKNPQAFIRALIY